MSSKIKVDTIENVAGSGNVSLGSGHNLVVPGNITGQGTAAITSNATVGGTLGVTGGTTLSSTANVGGQLTLSGTNFANSISMANSGTGGTTFTIFSTSDAYAQPSANWMLHHSSAGNGIILADQNGRVRMPYQPFVRLRLNNHINSGGSNVSFPGSQVTGFTVNENVGNYWNNSNNNFTCPVAGVYQVSVFFIKYPTSGACHVDLHKNGSTVDEVRWRAPEAGNHYYQAGGTASVTCAANDVLDWHYHGTAGVHNGNGSWEIKLSH